MKKILSMVAIMTLGVVNVNALTPVSTPVNNTAKLNYTVGSVAQSEVTSNQDTFLVDRLIDVQVVNNDPSKTIPVTPGATVQTLTFTIANQGNDAEDYDVLYEDVAAGVDQYNPTNCKVDVGAGYVAFPTTVNIGAEGSQVVTVQCDIPSLPNVSDGDDASIILKALIKNRTNDTNAVDVAGTVQNVMADAAGTASGDAINDGAHSDTATYHVVSADLTIDKKSCIVSDPINDAASGTTTVHRIPGAIIRYEFEVKNNGSADATAVAITDVITSEYGTSATNIEVRPVVCPGIDAGTGKCNAKTGSAEGNTHTGAGTSNITVNFATVATGTTECGFVEVTIQ